MGHATNKRLGVIDGAIGLVAATGARQFARHDLRFPAAPQSPSRVFLGLTDTYLCAILRAIWNSFAAAAARYHVTLICTALAVLDASSTPACWPGRDPD